MKRYIALLAATGMLAVASSAMAIPYAYNTRPITTIDETTGQPTLQNVLDGVVGTGKINAVTDQSKVGAWTTAEGNVDAYRISLLSPLGPGKLGIFSLATGKEYILFNATDGGGGYTADFSIDQNKVTGAYELTIGKSSNPLDTNFGEAFGFFWQDNNGNGSSTYKSYTLDSKNEGTNPLALSYLVPDGMKTTLQKDSQHTNTFTASGNNDWILAFDNGAETKVPGTKPAIYDSPNDFNDAVFYIEDMNPVPEPGTMVLLGAGLLSLAIYGKRKKNA